MRGSEEGCSHPYSLPYTQDRAQRGQGGELSWAGDGFPRALQRFTCTSAPVSFWRRVAALSHGATPDAPKPGPGPA